MDKEKFINFKKVLNMLNDKCFFGFTAKRKGNGRNIYLFKSIKWNNFLVTVETLKLNPNEIPSNKIVLGINVNGKQLDTLKDFINFLNFPPSINKQLKQ